MVLWSYCIVLFQLFTHGQCVYNSGDHKRPEMVIIVFQWDWNGMEAFGSDPTLGFLQLNYHYIIHLNDS